MKILDTFENVVDICTDYAYSFACVPWISVNSESGLSLEISSPLGLRFSQFYRNEIILLDRQS